MAASLRVEEIHPALTSENGTGAELVKSAQRAKFVHLASTSLSYCVVKIYPIA